MCLLQMFPPLLGSFSNSLDIVFHRAEVFNFNEAQLINDCFHGSGLWFVSKGFTFKECFPEAFISK